MRGGTYSKTRGERLNKAYRESEKAWLAGYVSQEFVDAAWARLMDWCMGIER